jgi:hypothetical protein
MSISRYCQADLFIPIARMRRGEGEEKSLHGTGRHDVRRREVRGEGKANVSLTGALQLWLSQPRGRLPVTSKVSRGPEDWAARAVAIVSTQATWRERQQQSELTRIFYKDPSRAGEGAER